MAYCCCCNGRLQASSQCSGVRRFQRPGRDNKDRDADARAVPHVPVRRGPGYALLLLARVRGPAQAAAVRDVGGLHPCLEVTRGDLQWPRVMPLVVVVVVVVVVHDNDDTAAHVVIVDDDHAAVAAVLICVVVALDCGAGWLVGG